MNDQLAFHIVQEAIRIGVREFCLCPGNRNGPLYKILTREPSLKKYFWPEERSAAFFALGRSKATGYPVAVITTSGSAAGELLPAAMEAYYVGVPLLLITADRPRRFRGTGAPQAVEQVNLFGVYAPFAEDIEYEEKSHLAKWDCRAPAHLNVCFEDPFPKGKKSPPIPDISLLSVNAATSLMPQIPIPIQNYDWLSQFLQQTSHPLVVVTKVSPAAMENVAQFLLNLSAPIFLESVSGLREDPRLQHLRITRTDNLLQSAEKAGYEIDGVLRIGGVPTFRLWRDLEELEGKIKVCSISDVPFSCLSWGDVIHADLKGFFGTYVPSKSFDLDRSEKWRAADRIFSTHLHALIEEEPRAETSLVHTLSTRIPRGARIHLGTSLPIREWDLAATNTQRGFSTSANRGVSGIDGQISTLLGWSQPETSNWALIGDLTALYDLAAPWILSQMEETRINLAIVNNGGGQLFARFIPEKNFINEHNLNFAPIAQMWSMHYERWEDIPKSISRSGHNMYEIVPDAAATARFNQKLALL